MRGQRLFVRPIDSGDSTAIADFLRENGEKGAVPAYGLLGKLVGNLVAALEFEIAEDGMQIRQIVVARELRRKRIGRTMIEEAERIAVKMERDRLIVEEPQRAREFFRRIGFVDDGARVVRRVKRDH